jgi:biotin operon repressor
MKQDNTAATEENIVMETTQPSYEDLVKRVIELETELAEIKANPVKAEGRKSEVLKYLQDNGHVKVADIAKHLGISDRNVSSQMTYLRKDGHEIATDSRGYKFLVKPEVKPAE